MSVKTFSLSSNTGIRCVGEEPVLELWTTSTETSAGVSSVPDVETFKRRNMIGSRGSSLEFSESVNTEVLDNRKFWWNPQSLFRKRKTSPFSFETCNDRFLPKSNKDGILVPQVYRGKSRRFYHLLLSCRNDGLLIFVEWK